MIAEDDRTRQEQETRLLAALVDVTSPQPWWLGYLDTGAHDTVFDRAPMVALYYGWRYILVQAGPAQAAAWREDDPWRGRLPDLIFPSDRSWLVSMLWDDDWRCVGGSRALMQAIAADDVLEPNIIGINDDAAPPGHRAV